MDANAKLSLVHQKIVMLRNLCACASVTHEDAFKTLGGILEDVDDARSEVGGKGPAEIECFEDGSVGLTVNGVYIALAELPEATAGLAHLQGRLSAAGYTVTFSDYAGVTAG